jgi:hypothetical protein
MHSFGDKTRTNYFSNLIVDILTKNNKNRSKIMKEIVNQKKSKFYSGFFLITLKDFHGFYSSSKSVPFTFLLRSF